jgi:hypothetical protein
MRFDFRGIGFGGINEFYASKCTDVKSCFAKSLVVTPYGG